MKIIHITGVPDSGEETFPSELINKIAEINPCRTGIIEETGELRIIPETGRKNIAYSAGIDNTGSRVAIDYGDLPGTLDLFSDLGAKYTIITGFEDAGFKKIILGDSEAENCILNNPSVGEVISSLEKFDEHYTMQGLLKELKEEIDIPKTGCYLSFNGIVREVTGDKRTEYMDFFDYERIDNIIADIRADMEKVPGILGVRFHHNKGRLYAGDDVTYIAVAASHRQEAFKAMMNAIDRLKTELHDK